MPPVACRAMGGSRSSTRRASVEAVSTGGRPTDTVSPGPLKLWRVVDRLMLVAPIRFALGAACTLLAWAVGARGAVAAVAFALGCVGLAAAALSDRRAVLLGRPERVPVPDDALYAGRLETALAACLPSAVALTVFSLMALLLEPTLAALLAGGIAGLGLAGLVSGLRVALQEREEQAELFVAKGARLVYARPLETAS
jgi:hypothetical protein